MKGKKVAAGLLAVMMTLGLLTGCGNSTGKSQALADSNGSVSSQPAEKQLSGEIVLYAAKSMTDCMDELISDYQAENPKVKIAANYASSGDLQSQIENGAPCDIYLSAAQTQMDALQEEGLIAAKSRRNLLTNQAVLIVPADQDNTVESFAALAEDTVEKIAIGDPASAPAGQYAKDILTELNIWDTIYEKSVLGSDVRQVLAWCETGEVDAGIVYATDAAISDAVKTVCTAPAEDCDLVIYPIALTIDGSENDTAKSFLAFLQTDHAAMIFKKYGFGIAE